MFRIYISLNSLWGMEFKQIDKISHAEIVESNKCQNSLLTPPNINYLPRQRNYK